MLTMIAQSNSTAIASFTFLIFCFLALAVLGVFVFLVYLVVRALLKYIKSKDVRKEKSATKVSLGEAIKEHRTRCKMTQ